MAAWKKPTLSKTLFGGREAAPKGYFAKFGFFQAAILYVLYIFCIYFVCILLYFCIFAIFWPPHGLTPLIEPCEI